MIRIQANIRKCGGGYNLRLSSGSGDWVSHKARKCFIQAADSIPKMVSVNAPISLVQVGGVFPFRRASNSTSEADTLRILGFMVFG